MTPPFFRNWTRVVSTAGFDESLLGACGVPLLRAAEPAPAIDAHGRLRAERIACIFAPMNHTRTLVLTGRDLCAGNRSWVYGYADRRRGVAVVSSCRLRHPGHPENTGRRLRSVVAHELGHLHGLAHCPTPGCVMHAAGDPAESDSRGEQPCGRCPSRPRWWRLALAAAACVLLFLCLDLATAALGPDRLSPFSVKHAGAGRAAGLLFAGQPVIELAVPPAGARELETRLNTAYRDMLPARFEVESLPSGSALVRLNGGRLFEVTPAEAGAATPAALAGTWSRLLAELVDGKGVARQSCPECHVARRAEVLAWQHSRGRR